LDPAMAFRAAQTAARLRVRRERPIAGRSECIHNVLPRRLRGRLDRLGPDIRNPPRDDI
jgi:hypothetical protein